MSGRSVSGRQTPRGHNRRPTVREGVDGVDDRGRPARLSGWGQIGPCLEPAYVTPYQSSALNFVAADVVANQAITPTRTVSGADICAFATSPAFHVVDLTGWFV